ncbi:hypothetical protein GGI12_003570 [Dipsacomyces acuminosporus]|nr:hypothetical protein GGI12_003570 [Dipsacomyces acuminosporus]
MHVLIQATTLSICLAFCTTVSSAVVPGLSKRVYGGAEVSGNTAPFLARLFFRTANGAYMNCGGAILSKNHIVTAAHCAFDQNNKVFSPNNTIVGYGSNDITKQIKVKALEIAVHPKATIDEDDTKTHDDIAIIKVPDIPLNEVTQTIPIYNYTINPGNEITAFGWGKTVPNDTASIAFKLKTTKLQVGSEKECHTFNPNFKSSNGPDICTLTRHTPDTTVCKGDSGTGAVIKSTNGYKLVGVISRGNSFPGLFCGRLDGYNFFSNLHHHLDFISTVTGLPVSYLTRSS